jgi:DGQHR domain-containing protein
MVSTTFTPRQLKSLTKVDIYNPDLGNDPSNGYQRRASSTRITQAAAFYGEGTDKRQGQEFEDRHGLMPNPIIANIRSDSTASPDVRRSGELNLPYGVDIVFNTDADRARVQHAVRAKSNATTTATLFLTEGAIAWVVDGQHRSGAIELLNDRDRLGDDFPIPVKMMVGFSHGDEMKQFYYINSQAKNVPTDLTAELLQRMARQDSDEAEYLSQRKNKGRLLAGAAIYEAMVADDSPWVARIRRPNDRASRETSIAVSQFITSLAPLPSAPMPRELTPDEWARIVDAFWEAVSRLLPQPFDPVEHPGDWVLFKATGVNTMHRVLADCLPIIIQRGGRLADVAQYEQLLADLPTLSGVAIDPNTGEERHIDGAEFWRSASIASQYTGRYGTDRLVGMIRGLISKASGAVNV